MRKAELLDAITASKKTGSFKLKIVFALNAEIFTVRHFVSSLAPMLRDGGIEIDDDTLMKLMAVAVRRRWQEDTDRVITVTMFDEFDEREFVAKLEPVIHDLVKAEAIPIEVASCVQRVRTGTTTPKKAIRHAYANGKRELRVVIPGASKTDVMIFMELWRNGFIVFISPDEQMVFEEAMRTTKWLFGNRLSAEILIKQELPEHEGRRIMDGAHVLIKTIKVA